MLALNGLLVGLTGLFHGPDEVMRRMALQVGLAAGARGPVLGLLLATSAARVYAVGRGRPGLRLALGTVMFVFWGFGAALFLLGAPDSAYLPQLLVLAVSNAWVSFRLGVDHVRSRSRR